MHLAVACAFALAFHPRSGAHLFEHASLVDRIAWILPAARLQAFARQGLVINEERRTTIVANAVASSSRSATVTLRGTVATTTLDVPRRQTRRSSTIFSERFTSRNDAMPPQRLAVEQAAISGLPAKSLCVGQSWQTHLPVVTSLGSGVATFTHTITGVDGDRVEIQVQGTGAITGAEYNLPRLLPGSIDVRGDAWFDKAAGIIVQESYVVRNRLTRSTKGRTLGFVETETVDITTVARSH